jgi:hypothetical protein
VAKRPPASWSSPPARPEQLTAIIAGNAADAKNERHEQADKALALLFWWSRSS